MNENQNIQLTQLEQEINTIQKARETAWATHMDWLKTIEFQEKSKDPVSYRKDISPRINALIEQRDKELKKLIELYGLKRTLLTAREKQGETKAAA